MIAEVLEEAIAIKALTIASMGPRSIDRGSAGQTQSNAAVAVLQWGRDQLIAEVRQKAKSRKAEIASMGPRSIDRGSVLDELAAAAVG